MNDPPSSHHARDRVDAERLRKLALSRKPGYEDPLREHLIIAEIVASFFHWTRGIVRGRVGGLDDPGQAADEIAADALRKLARALANKEQFNKPLRRVMLDNMDWARQSYFRRRGRQDDPPEPVDIETLELARDPPEGLPSEEDQARDFAARLDGLSERDRQIAIERFWVGRPPSEIAEMFGISDTALAAATTRAIQRLRASQNMRDVRKRLGKAD